MKRRTPEDSISLPPLVDFRDPKYRYAKNIVGENGHILKAGDLAPGKYYEVNFDPETSFDNWALKGFSLDRDKSRR